MDTINPVTGFSPQQQQGVGLAQSQSLSLPQGASVPQPRSVPQPESVSSVPLSPSTNSGNSLPEHVDSKRVADAVKDINQFFQMTERSLEFNVDKTSGRMVMQIIDNSTHELISQIPGEDVIKLAKRLDEVTGLLFKARA